MRPKRARPGGLVEDGGMVEWHLIADRPAIRSHPPGAMGGFCGVFFFFFLNKTH